MGTFRSSSKVSGSVRKASLLEDSSLNLSANNDISLVSPSTNAVAIGKCRKPFTPSIYVRLIINKHCKWIHF